MCVHVNICCKRTTYKTAEIGQTPSDWMVYFLIRSSGTLVVDHWMQQFASRPGAKKVTHGEQN